MVKAGRGVAPFARRETKMMDCPVCLEGARRCARLPARLSDKINLSPATGERRKPAKWDAGQLAYTAGREWPELAGHL